MDTLEYPRSEVPASALLISILALAVPVVDALFYPEALGQYGVILWLMALVPAFLLAYHKGWRGIAVAILAGMLCIVVTQTLLLALERPTPDWGWLMGTTGAYVAIALGVGWISEALHRERWVAERLAMTDPLTELPNRRRASLFLESEFAAARRGRPIAVVLFDLDGFREFNYEHGRRKGDEALETVAGLLSERTRGMNLTARYGGEEFLAVLSDADAAGAQTFAEKVREAVSRTRFDGDAMTVSAGVAVYTESMTDPAELVEAADRALYRAKRNGGDCALLARDQERERNAAVAEASPGETPEGPAAVGTP